ncbi:MAG TPA: hypothetical protein VGR53_05320 [Nitrososphaerales archaeon]|nr:hypothetical protein [Nitrososphaerales archaeon]
MRWLDIAIATMIGVSAISTIVTWNPRVADISSHRLMLESRLRDRLVSYVDHRGLPWIEQSSPESMCADLERQSNSIELSATIDSFSCGPSAPKGAAIMTLTLQLDVRDVTLQAWSSAVG